jgi:hypothetical protein
MTIEQTILQEIEESKRWLNLEKDESTYKIKDFGFKDGKTSLTVEGKAGASKS